jgi:hypothetical protein
VQQLKLKASSPHPTAAAIRLQLKHAVNNGKLSSGENKQLSR